MARLIDIYSPKGADSYPMTLDQLLVGSGDTITKGQVLAVLTGPDRTHKIGAPFNGTVTALNIEQGVRLGLRSPLLRMEVTENEEPAAAHQAAPEQAQAKPEPQRPAPQRPAPQNSAPQETAPKSASQAAKSGKSPVRRFAPYGVAAVVLFGLWQLTPNTRFTIMYPEAGFSLPFGIAQDFRRIRIQFQNMSIQVSNWFETSPASKPPLELTCEAFAEQHEKVNFWGAVVLDKETADYETVFDVSVDFSGQKACLAGAFPDDWIGGSFFSPKNDGCYSFTQSGDVITIDRKQTVSVSEGRELGTVRIDYRIGDATLDTAKLTLSYKDQGFIKDELERAQTLDMQCRKK